MSKRILVIDDDESIRKSFILALEDTGYHIETAESGQAGIDKHKTNPYNLIFLDMKMPGLNGAQTLRQIRHNDTTVSIYIVTAFSKEFFKELKGINSDGIAYELIKKPIGNDEIIEITNAILGGSGDRNATKKNQISL